MRWSSCAGDAGLLSLERPFLTPILSFLNIGRGQVRLVAIVPPAVESNSSRAVNVGVGRGRREARFKPVHEAAGE